MRARHEARKQLPRSTYKRDQLKKRKAKKEGENRSGKKSRSKNIRRYKGGKATEKKIEENGRRYLTTKRERRKKE